MSVDIMILSTVPLVYRRTGKRNREVLHYFVYNTVHTWVVVEIQADSHTQIDIGKG